MRAPIISLGAGTSARLRARLAFSALLAVPTGAFAAAPEPAPIPGATVASAPARATATAPATQPTVAMPAVQNDTTTPRRVRWDPRWARFGAGDFVATGLFGGLGLVTKMAREPDSWRRSGPILLDGPIHEVVRADSVDARSRARIGSDIGVGVLLAAPYLFDSVALTWLYRRSPDAALQMALINGEAMAIAAGVHGLTSFLVARERPFGEACVEDPEGHDCPRSDRYRSFFSSHTMHAFNAASLMCSHHLKHRLLGGAADALTCAGGLALASSVGVLRMMGDMHYTSDVLIGAAVGSALGFGVPLLHYGGGIPELGLGPRRDGQRLMLLPSVGGVAVSGNF